MKLIPNLLASVIVASCAIAIAILSVQNATLVSLRFLNFQSIQIPLGIVLATSTGLGILGGAIAPLLAGDSNVEDDSPPPAANRQRYDTDTSNERW